MLKEFGFPEDREMIRGNCEPLPEHLNQVKQSGRGFFCRAQNDQLWMLDSRHSDYHNRTAGFDSEEFHREAEQARQNNITAADYPKSKGGHSLRISGCEILQRNQYYQGKLIVREFFQTT